MAADPSASVYLLLLSLFASLDRLYVSPATAFAGIILNVTARFLCIRVLLSYPNLCDVFRIGVLGLSSVLAHFAYDYIHTVLFNC